MCGQGRGKLLVDTYSTACSPKRHPATDRPLGWPLPVASLAGAMFAVEELAEQVTERMAHMALPPVIYEKRHWHWEMLVFRYDLPGIENM